MIHHTKLWTVALLGTALAFTTPVGKSQALPQDSAANTATPGEVPQID